MITWLGTKKIKLDTIIVPSGFAKRKKELHVGELAKSITTGGLISLPVIRELAGKRYLVAGGDRLAALMLNKVAQHEVRLVRGEDDEIETITLDENLFRRRTDDYDAMVKRRVELTTENLEAAKEEIAAAELLADVADKEPAKRGRPKTAKGAAREKVAQELGTTPEAVRQREKRADAKANPKPAKESLFTDPVETWDLEIDAAAKTDFVSISTIHIIILDVERSVKAARNTAKGLADMGKIGESVLAKISSDLHNALDSVKRASPDAVCPYCKDPSGKAKRRKKCNGCGGLGYVNNSQLKNIDSHLLLRGSEAMVPNGEGGFVAIAEDVNPEVDLESLALSNVEDDIAI